MVAKYNVDTNNIYFLIVIIIVKYCAMRIMVLFAAIFP